MCHVGYTTLRVLVGCVVLIEYLKHDPKAEDDDGGKLKCGEEESEEDKIAHSVSRKHYEICAEHSGYCARCAQRRDRRIRIDKDLSERSSYSAEQIKDQKLPMPEVVL